MPQGREKSGRFRRIFKRTPGARNKVVYEESLPKAAVCAKCGSKLQGIPRVTRNLPKTKKRPERPYGGHYCSTCSRELIRQKARK